MSWFFGRKKHQKDSDCTAIECAEEEQNSDQSEGYVHVPRWPKPVTTSDPSEETVSYPSSNLYPHVPSVPTFGGQVLSSDTSKDSNQGDGAHYLNGVPFKLCKHLENTLNSDLEIDKLRISEILSFIERIEGQRYDYGFSLEEGVIAEMNSRSGE